MLTIPCTCGRLLELPEESAGGTVTCPWCTNEMPVPGGPALVEPEAPVTPALDPGEDLADLTTVGLAEAHALVGSLNAAGIPAIVWEQDATYFGGASGAKVKVRPRDLDAARAMLGPGGRRGLSARGRRILLFFLVLLTLFAIFVLSR